MIALLLIILMFAVNIEFVFKIINNSNKSSINITLFSITIFKLKTTFKFDEIEKSKAKIVLDKFKKEYDIDYKKFLLNGFKYLRQRKPIKGIDFILSHINIKNLSIYVQYGLDDAAATAVAYGFISSIFIPIEALVKSKSKKTQIKYKVIPCFDQLLLKLNIDCIIAIKVGHIIIGVLKMLSKKMYNGGVIYGTASN